MICTLVFQLFSWFLIHFINPLHAIPFHSMLRFFTPFHRETSGSLFLYLFSWGDQWLSVSIPLFIGRPVAVCFYTPFQGRPVAVCFYTPFQGRPVAVRFYTPFHGETSGSLFLYPFSGETSASLFLYPFSGEAGGSLFLYPFSGETSGIKWVNMINSIESWDTSNVNFHYFSTYYISYTFYIPTYS